MYLRSIDRNFRPIFSKFGTSIPFSNSLNKFDGRKNNIYRRFGGVSSPKLWFLEHRGVFFSILPLQCGINLSTFSDAHLLFCCAR